MVVLAIMAVLMTLSGGLMQKSINQQTRQVELEKVRQLFKKLSYQAYYSGKAVNLRFEGSQILITHLTSQTSTPQINVEDSLLNSRSDNSEELPQEIINFEQLIFVAKDYLITSKGAVNQSYYQVFQSDEIVTFPLYSLFENAAL